MFKIHERNHFENTQLMFQYLLVCCCTKSPTLFKMHNILQTFNILYRVEFIFVQISIQGWINAAHLFPKPSGSNSISSADQFSDPWVCSPNIIFLAKSLKLFNRISFFLLIQVPIKVTMNQNLHPVLTDGHSLISRGELNQNVHAL